MIVYILLTGFVIAAAAGVKMPEGSPYKAAVSRQYLYNRIAVGGIFLALFAVSALRVNVGNDYATYVEFMHRIDSGFTNYVPTEPGFNMLTALLYRLSGFENFYLVFAVIAALTILFFLAGIRRLSVHYGWSIALFMLLGYYFQSISTVRYYLALGLAFYLVKDVLDGDWVRVVLLALIGASFHKSMLVILVLYPLASVRWGKVLYALFAAACVSCLFFQDYYLELLVRVYPSYRDTVYLEGGTSLVNIIRSAAVVALALYCYRGTLFESEDRTLNFYFHAGLMTLAFYVFGSFLPIVSRIAYYTGVTQIVFVPMCLKKLADQKGTRQIAHALRIAVAGVSVLYFAVYMMRAGNDGIRILPYQTFLFHEMVPILSETGIH